MGLRLTSWNRNTRRQSIDMWIWDASTTCLRQRRRPAEVKRHTHDYQDAYARAYRCLKAARQVELDTAAEIRQCFDSQRAARRISGIMARELRGWGTGTGRITRRFLGSVTHKGPVWAVRQRGDALFENLRAGGQL